MSDVAALPADVIADVLATFRKTGSPYKTVKKTGVDIKRVFEIINDNFERIAEAEERHGGMGRPDIQPFLVARRKANTRGWNNTDPAIIRARADLELGTHIMATGRDGQWFLLYSIPRKGKPQPLPNYFRPEVA